MTAYAPLNCVNCPFDCVVRLDVITKPSQHFVNGNLKRLEVFTWPLEFDEQRSPAWNPEQPVRVTSYSGRRELDRPHTEPPQDLEASDALDVLF
jgi:hypothetical protein